MKRLQLHVDTAVVESHMVRMVWHILSSLLQSQLCMPPYTTTTISSYIHSGSPTNRKNGCGTLRDCGRMPTACRQLHTLVLFHCFLPSHGAST